MSARGGTRAGEVVAALIDAIERKDLAAVDALCGDDVEYENVPLATVRGRDAVRLALAPFLESSDEIEWRVHRQVATGGDVMNERLDRFLIAGRWVEIRVAGVFRVEDGKVVLWRDYFDFESLQRALQADTAVASSPSAT